MFLIVHEMNAYRDGPEQTVMNFDIANLY